MEAALAITLLAPFPPMLFMGEEWGCRQPFPFFCDFTGDLARAVEEGRRREFAAIYDQAASGHEPPSALDPETFRTATLDWENWTKSSLDRYETVRLLLVARDREIVPRLVGARPIRIEIRDAAEPLVHVTWALADGSALTLLANLSAEVVPLDLALPAQDPFWGSNPTAALSPWQVVWWLEAL
jgi:1,4-alpha-glucan branching enzyme